MKKKYVFLGDTKKSINLELVFNSHKFLQDKVKYILLGNLNDLKNYSKKNNNQIKINRIVDPFNFDFCKKDFLNIFDITNSSKKEYENLIQQIKLSNFLANKSKIDLVTLPINKSLIKKKEISFVGMTEYLGDLNKKKTIMLMVGESFSVIPITTHINPKNIFKYINSKNLTQKIKQIESLISKKEYNLQYKKLFFLCYNPHCGEENTLGSEDKIISNVISKFDIIQGPYAADSAFKNLNKNQLIISMYHDQVLIPFKIMNKRGLNMTLGLNYRRLSPAHGTAKEIIDKNIADNSSYLACMEY